jgi:hypothetical protein
MSVDDAESMIMLEVSDLKNPRISVFVIKLDNNREETFNMSAIFMTTILTCRMMIFAIAIANYSRLADDS